ncbi:TonB-dependent receptor [Marinilabilia sp.]|uniref:TonB-dependent receptor n=1 Tax=Marinilabilia sp. TaxID=2021252 RepID=UPI0025C46439|nr:TonB-dependent receptor [Marinilabilia sp.]
MQKFFWTIVLLLWGMGMSAYSQSTSLSGKITTSKSGKPLPEAHIYFKGTNIGTASNNKGLYEFNNIKPGNHSLIVSFNGFKRISRKVEIVKGRNEMDFSLEESNNNLGEVVVTGTGTAHHLKTAPVPTELISSKEVKSVGASDFNDLMLSISPSFDFSPGTMGAFMKLNGLSNDFIVVLIDGKRMFGDVGGNVDLNRINPDNIERIEILKGASSLLYGSDAIAGVVNIITKETRQNSHFSNTTRIRGNNTWQQNNVVEVEGGRLSSHTSFSRKSSDGWQLSKYEEDDGELIETDEKTMKAYEDFTVTQKFEFAATPKLDFYANGTYYQKDMFRQQSVADYGYYYQDETYGAGAKYLLGGRDYISFDYHHDQFLYYYRYNHDDADGGFLKDQKTINNDQRLDNARLKYLNVVSPNNTLTVGIDYLNEKMVSADRLVDGEADAYTMALYAQDEMTIFDALDVVAGARYVNHKEFGSAFTPKLSALYKLGDFNIRSTFGLGFKAPTLKELYYNYEKRGRVYLGNTELNPQESEYLSAGVEYNTRFISLSVSVYRNNVDNLIDYVAGKGDNELIHDNISEARSEGIDVLLDVKAGAGFTFGGGYSYVNARNLISDIRLDGVAEHSGNARVTYEHHWKNYALNANIFGRLQSDKFYDGDLNAKGYDLWNFTTNHTFSNLGSFIVEVSAGVDNIFDYVDDSPLGTHYGTLTPGRTFFAGLRINFSE